MIIYKITNLLNNKIYVGQTVQPLHKRWTRHCSPHSECTYLKNAIAKYGKENFKIENIKECNSLKQMNYWESFYIILFNSTNKYIGYNCNYGGDNKALTQETKQKISKSMSGYKNHFFNKKHTSESLKKQKIKRLNRKNHISGKSIVCIETNEIFISITQASKKYKINRRKIYNQIYNKVKNSRSSFNFKFVGGQ
jgi:group I intron endonuclease